MSTRKKTLFVDARWLAQPGQGVYTYFHEIYSRLVRRDLPDIDIIFGVLPGHLPDFLPAHAKVVEYERDNFLWRQWSLGRVINRLQPDMVHFQYVLPMWLDRRIHAIVALHDVIFLEHPEFFPISYRLTRRIFFGASAKRADSLLTISHKSARDISKHLGIDRSRIDVIPLGAGSRLHAVQPEPVKDVSPQSYILTVGRHEPRKNYPRLIEAFVASRLHETHGLRLIIAGWVAPEFRDQGGLQAPGVMLLTDCSDAQLAWLFTHARGFVFPSIAEGYGLPLVEALEFNVPSATSNTHPIDEVRAACLSEFDPYSMPQIRDSLLALADAPRASTPMTSTIPSWDDYVDRFVEVLRRAPPRGDAQ